VSPQAANIGMDFEQLLLRLRTNVPAFVQFLCEEQGIDRQIERL
jgi:hypothetical protein